ncbi:MAG: endonuclease, partial [Bacteroidales bacterium]|nr:endonuclease [Bacteroidales bacterium]
PHNTSIVKYLKADGSAQNSDPFRFSSWSTEWIKNSKWIGTYKFKNQWIIIDQIITSQAFVSNKNKQKYCMVSRAEIFAPPFLLTDDEKFGTKKPLRTYNGMKYIGGFSDHLPVLLKLECRLCQAR